MPRAEIESLPRPHMVSARLSLGAGRIPTGNASVPNQISNRHWMRLEIAVTPRKQSPDPISNRHKNTLVPAPFFRKIACAARSASTIRKYAIGRQSAYSVSASASALAFGVRRAIAAVNASTRPRTNLAPSEHHVAFASVAVGQRSALTRQPLVLPRWCIEHTRVPCGKVDSAAEVRMIGVLLFRTRIRT
jgi:hypothetical protein